MSIRIALENQPEFYTNLDILQGHVVLSLTRAEHVGAIIVKLEGESRTALGMPPDGSSAGVSTRDLSPGGDILNENHKILYKVAQVFPDENKPPMVSPFVLAPGMHRFPFQFKVPFNNACADPSAMARLGGLTGQGGIASGSGLFGLGGIRVMDGTKQMMYTHVKKTLPPSFTGFPGEAEIRYYVKVTIQRPGLFRENWRYQVGLKFLPIEPPRPPKTNQEAYARRPFAFRPKSRTPSPAPGPKKRASLFGFRTASGNTVPTTPTGNGALGGPSQSPPVEVPPSIEMSARLPHPAILTCNKPVPLRLIATKLAPADAEVFLIAMQIDLIGQTIVRCQDLIHTEVTRWMVMSRQGLSIPISQLGDAVGSEVAIPDALWAGIPLPNTVMPSFVTCNLSRSYQLEVRLGLAWGKPAAVSGKGKGRVNLSDIPQEIHLPLHFSAVEVYSGLSPPSELVEAMRQGQAKRRKPARPVNQQQHQQQQPPMLPPRQNQATAPAPAPAPAPSQVPIQHQPQTYDPLYPPQLAPGQTVPPYDDAPPSYDEAMAEAMPGPAIPSTARPAYSGVTNENEPSTLPEKN